GVGHPGAELEHLGQRLLGYRHRRLGRRRRHRQFLRTHARTYDRPMARILVILPTATYRAPDFMAAARRLGVEVVVASEHRQAMSEEIGDRALVLPLRQPALAVDAIAALHERTPLDAAVAVDDTGLAVAALASERLGLG